MAISIATNMASIRASNDLSRVDIDSSSRRERLASGHAVNAGRDGGAELYVSEGMRAEIGGLTQGARNAEQALDLLRTAEGGMNEVSSILIRMREMAVQSSSDTLNDSNRESLDAEFGQLKEHIDRIVGLANYNEQSLLRGFGNEIDASFSTALTDAADTGVRRITLSAALSGNYTFIDNPGDNEITIGNGVTTQTVNLGSRTVDGNVATGTTQVVNFDLLGVKVTLAGEQVKDAAGAYVDGELDGKTLIISEGTGGSFQLGSDAVAADRMEYDIPDLSTNGGILDITHLSIGTRDAARGNLSKMDQAIHRLSTVRGEVGAVSNRLTHTLDFTANSIERINASESTVRDADYALETTHLARNEILRQSTAAVFGMSQTSTNIAMNLLQF
jgi:flagellin